MLVGRRRSLARRVTGARRERQTLLVLALKINQSKH